MILNDRQIIELAERGIITPFRRCIKKYERAVEEVDDEA